MTSVSSTSSSSDALSAATSSQTGGKTLGKDDFLKLLTAQLSNQDPLKPMDNTEFVSQLAQFSALEQQLQSNTHLSNLETAETAMNNAQVTNLVGKTITAEGKNVALSGGVAVNESYTLGAAATDVTVTIRNSDGDAVRTMKIGAQSAGAHSAIWDGTNDTGTKQPDGAYTIEVAAKDAGGKTVDASMQVTGLVTSVNFTSSGAMLVIGATGQKVKPADVTTVAQTASTTL